MQTTPSGFLQNSWILLCYRVLGKQISAEHFQKKNLWTVIKAWALRSPTLSFRSHWHLSAWLYAIRRRYCWKVPQRNDTRRRRVSPFLCMCVCSSVLYDAAEKFLPVYQHKYFVPANPARLWRIYEWEMLPHFSKDSFFHRTMIGPFSNVLVIFLIS